MAEYSTINLINNKPIYVDGIQIPNSISFTEQVSHIIPAYGKNLYITNQSIYTNNSSNSSVDLIAGASKFVKEIALSVDSGNNFTLSGTMTYENTGNNVINRMILTEYSTFFDDLDNEPEEDRYYTINLTLPDWRGNDIIRILPHLEISFVPNLGTYPVIINIITSSSDSIKIRRNLFNYISIFNLDSSENSWKWNSEISLFSDITDPNRWKICGNIFQETTRLKNHIFDIEKRELFCRLLGGERTDLTVNLNSYKADPFYFQTIEIGNTVPEGYTTNSRLFGHYSIYFERENYNLLGTSRVNTPGSDSPIPSFYSLNEITNSWINQGDISFYSTYGQAVRENRDLYIFMGSSISSGTETFYNGVHNYNSILGTWNTQTNATHERAYFGYFQMEVHSDGEVGSFIGGHNDASSVAVIENYNFISNTWTTGSSLTGDNFYKIEKSIYQLFPRYWGGWEVLYLNDISTNYGRNVSVGFRGVSNLNGSNHMTSSIFTLDSENNSLSISEVNSTVFAFTIGRGCHPGGVYYGGTRYTETEIDGEYEITISPYTNNVLHYSNIWEVENTFLTTVGDGPTVS